MPLFIQKTEERKTGGTFLRKLSLSSWIAISFITMTIDILHWKNLSQVRSGILNVTTPVIKLIETPVVWIRSVNDTVGEFREQIEDNKKLKQEILKLQEYKNQYYVLKQENISFKKLLRYNRNIEKSFITSRVIGDTGGIYHRTLLLDRGSKDNIAKNDGVMGISGLLGKIVDASYNNSRVLLLTDLNSALPVFIMGANERAIMQGDSSDFPTLTFIEEIKRIKVGQKVITSGDGGMLPNGIPVGEVIAINGLQAKVRLYANGKNSLFTRIVKFKYVRK